MNIVNSAGQEMTTSVSSMNVEPDTSVKSVAAEESAYSAPEVTTTVDNILKNSLSTEKVNSVAESPAAKGRSSKQLEADKGAAEILKRMRELYNVEFANVPANKRPKPQAWAARAALYKNEREREEYIKKMVQNARNSLSSKNSAGNNSNMGNNADSVFQRLMQEVNTAKTALTAVTRLVQELKNVTRKGKRMSNASYYTPVTNTINAGISEPSMKYRSMKYRSNGNNSSFENNSSLENRNSSLENRISPIKPRKKHGTKSRRLSQNITF